MNLPIIIGTRGSELALWQANFTKNELAKHGITSELKIIKTKGDATQQWNLSFDKIEGKGFFTKELEDALLANEIDMAVHSCKDLPTEFPEGLTITAYSKRANPFDILLIKKDKVDNTKFLKLKDNALVGTSSARRKSQLLALRPDIQLCDLRGNVPSRIKKLKEEQYDAITLASAGVERLNINLSEFELVHLSAPMFIPAPAQGVLAFQIRENDDRLKEICTILNDKNSAEITLIERQILHDFEGGCQMPLGVYAEKLDEQLHIWVSQATAWNTFPKRKHYSLKLTAIQSVAKLSEDIVHDFKNSSIESIFISSDIDQQNYLIRALEAQQSTVQYHTFIQFSSLDFELPNNINWIFFSSKNGVKFFFDNIKDNTLLNSVKLAAVNQGTAQAIQENGLNVSFIGAGSDLKIISENFDKMASGKIIFVQAKNSLRSIQKGIQKNKDFETIIAYKNEAKMEIEKRHESSLIFTSPLNVEAYVKHHKLDSNQQIISIGNSTTNKLIELGIYQYKTAFEPTWWAILDEL